MSMRKIAEKGRRYLRILYRTDEPQRNGRGEIVAKAGELAVYDLQYPGSYAEIRAHLAIVERMGRPIAVGTSGEYPAIMKAVSGGKWSLPRYYSNYEIEEWDKQWTVCRRGYKAIKRVRPEIYTKSNRQKRLDFLAACFGEK